MFWTQGWLEIRRQRRSKLFSSVQDICFRGASPSPTTFKRRSPRFVVQFQCTATGQYCFPWPQLTLSCKVLPNWVRTPEVHSMPSSLAFVLWGKASHLTGQKSKCSYPGLDGMGDPRYLSTLHSQLLLWTRICGLSLQLVGNADDTGGVSGGTNYRGASILHMLSSFSAVSLSIVQIHPFRPPQVTLQVRAGLRFSAKILGRAAQNKSFHRAWTRSRRPCL